LPKGTVCTTRQIIVDTRSNACGLSQPRILNVEYVRGASSLERGVRPAYWPAAFRLSARFFQ